MVPSGCWVVPSVWWVLGGAWWAVAGSGYAMSHSPDFVTYGTWLGPFQGARADSGAGDQRLLCPLGDTLAHG